MDWTTAAMIHCRHAEHGELAEGIEATELNDDDGDDVVGAGHLSSLGEVPQGEVGAVVAAQQGVDAEEGDHAGDGSDDGREDLA